MMNDFNRCKGTGVRWLKKSIEEMRVTVKIKPQDGILSLPKFEDYANETNDLTIKNLESKLSEYTFKWQEKVFSSWELVRYSDVHNCISEIELDYNEMINNFDYEPSKIFTYIHQDYHLPLPNETKKHGSKVPDLTSCFEKLSLNEKIGNVLCSVYLLKDTSSMGHLFRSSENITSMEEQWTAMHIVFDNSEYNEDAKLLLKQEAPLLSLYHNKTHNYLIISPDVNSLDLNPYTVETANGLSFGYQYSVDLEFEDNDAGPDLLVLLAKLHKKWERQQRQLINFEMPELGKKQFCVTLEILTANDFDMNNLYIEFDIKIPEGLDCYDALHGRTHVTKKMTQNNEDKWHFGHIVELNLEMDLGEEPLPIQFFFEVISKDWWGRHRTEGYGYLPLTLVPGHFTRQLSCSRPDEMDSVAAEIRRFFVGGCHLISNLDVLAKPQLMDSNFKLTPTGQLYLRWNTITQDPHVAPLTRSLGTSSGSASALLVTAEAVLRQYRKARARLAAATEGLAREGRASGES